MGVPFDTDGLEGEVIFSAFETDETRQLVVTVPASWRFVMKTCRRAYYWRPLRSCIAECGAREPLTSTARILATCKR